MLRADLTEYGQALGALEGAEAVIHLANIPAPGLCTPAVTFNANITMNFNVFHAVSKVASETIAGQIATWSGIPFVALRFSNIMVSGDYREFPSVWPDPHARK